MTDETNGLEAQGGQVEETPAESQEQPEGKEENWSINDVPKEYRSFVEQAVKPFQSKYTKTKQEYEAAKKAWETEKQGYIPRSEYSDFESKVQAILQNPQLYEQARKALGYIEDQVNKPDGWEADDAKKIRQLLFNEFKGEILKDLSPYIQATSGVQKHMESILHKEAENEIQQTQDEVTKAGLPWSEDIIRLCIAAVAEGTRQGKNLSLKQAYDLIVMPIMKSKDAIEASKSQTKKGLKTMPPTAPGDKQLTGDEKLKKIISDLPIQEESL